MIVLVPGAFFHLYAACKSIKQEDILQKSSYTGFYIFSVFLRIVLEVVAFWLQIQLFGFKVNAIYICDVGALDKKFNITRCMVPEHFEKTIFLIAMYTFTVITVILCVAEIFEISCRRLGILKTQWCYLALIYCSVHLQFCNNGFKPQQKNISRPLCSAAEENHSHDYWGRMVTWHKLLI